VLLNEAGKFQCSSVCLPAYNCLPAWKVIPEGLNFNSHRCKPVATMKNPERFNNLKTDM